MMKPVNQKLISSAVSRYIGYALLSVPLTFAAKCGSLIETTKCIAEKYELKRPCKPLDTKLISAGPNAETSINTTEIIFVLENGNEDGFDPINSTATVRIGSNAPFQIPTSALNITKLPGATKLGNISIGIRVDNTVENLGNPLQPINTPYGETISVTLNSGTYSAPISYVVVENPAGISDIDNDQVLVEVPSVNQIVLRNVFNNYRTRTLNLSTSLPGVAGDYVFSQIEGNKLFMLRDIGVSSRTAAGDSMNTGGHQAVEIDLMTGQVVNTTVPSQNTPLFNVMESLINAHQGPSSTLTTAVPPADWRIYPVLRRNHITNGADADLAIRMYYNGGEYQEIIIPNAFPFFGGALPALSVKLTNNTFVIMTEPGRMLRMTFDYNGAAAIGSKVSSSFNFFTVPLTLSGALPGEYVLGHDIVENKNVPGEVLVLYSDINSNRYVQRYDTAGSYLGNIALPNSVVKLVSFASSPALGLYHNGTNQIQVMNNPNFGTGIIGSAVFSNNASTNQLVVLPKVPGLLNESAAQTLDTSETYNKSQAGISVVNLTTQQIEKRTVGNTLSSTVDVSGLITILKTNLGTTNNPNDAKVIEQGNNYILVLKINDGVRERVAVLDMAASAAAWISPAGSDCEMVYGAGKYNDSGTDRLLVLYHLVGGLNYVIDNGVTTYSGALAGASINTMVILDPDYTNGSPTQIRVAVGKTDSLQLLTFNKSNLSAPVSNTTILNNLVALVGANVNNGSVLSIQASAGSDDDLASSTLYVLEQVQKGGVPKQMLLSVNTTGTLNASYQEWNVTSKDVQGFKRLSDGRFVLVALSGASYVMDTTGSTYRTLLSNMKQGNIYK